MKCVIICCVYLLVLVDKWASVSSMVAKSVDRITASETCGRHGLAPFTSLDDLLPWTSDLAEGQSAWISGYVQYSPYIAFLGCYKRKVVYNTGRIVDYQNFIYACAESCKESTTYYYFVTHQRYCSCVTVVQGHEILWSPLTCTVEMKDMIAPGYINNDEYYLLYAIRHEVEELLPRQCVHVKWLNGSAEKMSSSCYSLEDVPVNGYICKAITTPLPGCHDDTGNRFRVCAYTGRTTWTDAFKLCYKESGILINSAEDYRILQVHNITDSYQYWTGLFRTYTLIDGDEESMNGEDKPSVCLSITKISGQLLYDPDNCTAEKYYVCSYNSSVTDSPTTNSTSPRPISEIPQTTDTATTVAEQPATNKSVPVFVYLIVAVVVVVVVVVVVCVVVTVWLRRKAYNNRHFSSAQTNLPPKT